MGYSFIPALSNDDIASQLRYGLSRRWAVSIEYTRDPHPRNVYWDMHFTPKFYSTGGYIGSKDAAGILKETTKTEAYQKINQANKGKQATTSATNSDPGKVIDPRQEATVRSQEEVIAMLLNSSHTPL